MFVERSEARESSPALFLQLGIGTGISAVGAGMAAQTLFSSLKVSGHFLILGSLATAVIVTIALGWHRVRSTRTLRFGKLRLPIEVVSLIVPSGICTALAAWTSASLFFSNNVAGAFLMITVAASGGLIDHWILRKKADKRAIKREEILASLFATLTWLAIAALLPQTPLSAEQLALMLTAGIAGITRLYFIQLFKTTRPRGALLDARGFIAVELFTAGLVWALISVFVGAPVAALEQAIAFAVPWGVSWLLASRLLLFPNRSAAHSSAAFSVAHAFAWLILHAGNYGSLTYGFSLALALVAVAFLSLAEKHLARSISLDPGQSWRISHEVPVRLRRSPDSPDGGSPPGPRAF